MPKIITKKYSAKIEDDMVVLTDDGVVEQQKGESIAKTEEASVGDNITRMAQAVNEFNQKQMKMAYRVWKNDPGATFKVKQQSIEDDPR